MKAQDVQEWMNSPVGEAYFSYLRKRISAFKESRGDGALLNADPYKMYRANWELVGGLSELEALAGLPYDDDQVLEVFGIEKDDNDEV